MGTTDITSDPKGPTYEALIDYLGKQCPIFSLVWQEHFSFDDSARMIAEQLRTSLIREQRTDEWPGTRIYGGMAIVRYYKVTQQSLKILRNQLSLFSWMERAMPEDLAFYDEFYKCAFGSISHEKDAWFEDELFDIEDIKAKIPGIKLKRN